MTLTKMSEDESVRTRDILKYRYIFSLDNYVWRMFFPLDSYLEVESEHLCNKFAVSIKDANWEVTPINAGLFQ